MQAQKPARGIMETGEWKDARSYLITCGCGTPEHSHQVFVESQPDTRDVTVTIYTTEYTSFSGEPLRLRYDIENDWLQSIDWAWKRAVNGVIRRCRLTWQLWWHGEVQYEADLILDRQTAINYAQALEQAVRDFDQTPTEEEQ